MPGPSDGPMTREQFFGNIQNPMQFPHMLQWIMEKPEDAERFARRKGRLILEGFPSVWRMILKLSFHEQADLICHGFWVVHKLEEAGKEALASAALLNIFGILEAIRNLRRYNEFPTSRALLSVILGATCNLINKDGGPTLKQLITVTELLKRI